MIEAGRKVRIGDGTGEATVEAHSGEEVRVRYPSGARRTVAARNVASPGGATLAERELLRDLLAAGDDGLRYPDYRWRVAVLALRDAGALVEEGPVLLLTARGEDAARRAAA